MNNCFTCGEGVCEKCCPERAHAQQPAQLIAAQQAEDEGLWCIPKTAMEGHLQKELRRLTEAVEGKTSAECLRELLLKPPVQQPATEPRPKCDYTGAPSLDPKQCCRCETCQKFASALALREPVTQPEPHPTCSQTIDGKLCGSGVRITWTDLVGWCCDKCMDRISERISCD